ncbi:MAG: DNA-directed DNA polymerase I [Candidatus Heimdallarchaeota archaeon]|nr:DNA-directed DNA polymerase I [Candidatus Heimdallarchaeota archaeon]
MSWSDFFDEEETIVEQKPKEKKPVIQAEVKEEHKPKTPALVEKVPKKEIQQESFEVGQDIEDIFLLDVIYEPKTNGAQCIFYHEPSQSLYRWNDTTNHEPYLLTDLPKSVLEVYEPLIKSQEFDRIEEVQRMDLLLGKTKTYSQVFGKTPLSIGGSNRSMRNIIDPSYEADIRYHLNFISDRAITPGTYYSVKNGDLIPKNHRMNSEMRKEMELAFKGEEKKRFEMLDFYMPLLFQPIPDILRASFDIEVGSEKNKMPNVSNPLYEIISIALADNEGRKICWLLNRDEVNQDVKVDFDLRRFDNELELIDDFLVTINNYPVVLSFNGDNFDCPYLVNRAMKLGMEEDDIPIKLRRTESTFSYSIHLDLHQFFRQASIRLYAFSGKYESASLDNLSTTLLGMGKLEHPDVWINEMDAETLIKYNILDAELTLKLSQFDDNIALNLMIILMRISKMPIYDFSRSAVSRWLHMWLVFEHRQRGYIIPRKSDIIDIKGGGTSDAIIDGKKFQGAIVLDPKPGIWWNVHVLDFASLYPSIIKTKNLSYETIRCEHSECRSNVVPGLNHWICTKQPGMFSILLGFIRDTRVKWFKPRASKKNPDIKDRRINNIIQSSLKVLINAGYGVVGSEAFDFYCLPVAESTTAFARDAIMATRNYIQNTLHIDVLYGDTDSVFIYNPSKEAILNVMEWGDKHIGIELGTDYEFRYVVFSDRKKNYFGITKDNVAIVKGLMAKKSNTPTIIRKTFSDILELLKTVMDKKDLEDAKYKINNRLKDLIFRLKNGQFEIEDISIRLTLSRKLSDYTTWTHTVQAAVQLINQDPNLSANDFAIGDRLEFVKLDKPIQVMIPEGFSFNVGEIKYSSIIPVDNINSDTRLSGQPAIEIAESTFSQIIQSLGLSWDRIMGKTSLEDFF